MVWRKSAASNDQGGACVEVAATSHGVAVRDSKARKAGYIVISKSDFQRIVTAFKARRQ